MKMVLTQQYYQMITVILESTIIEIVGLLLFKSFKINIQN